MTIQTRPARHASGAPFAPAAQAGPTTAPARSSVRPTARSPLRWVAALTLLATGATHIPVIVEHLHEAPYIGVLFLALTAVTFTLALVLVDTDRPLVWAASAVICALAVGGYLLSRATPLPQIGDDVGNWTEPLGLAAISVEATTVLLAAWRLLSRRR